MKLNSAKIFSLKVYELNLRFDLLDCGGEFTESSGTITSAGYPEAYRPDIQCVWRIRSKNPNHVIRLKVNDIDMEHSNDCRSDQLEIRYITCGGEQSFLSLLHRYFVQPAHDVRATLYRRCYNAKTTS